MTIPLKQSTASQEIPLGYFLDSTNGDTEETGLTISNTDIKLWKMGATTLANKNSGGATHISNGVYYCVLDATDTNTLGGMVVFVHESGALSVKVDCVVYPANVYDSLFSTDKLQVDLTQCGGSTVAAGAIPNAAADAAGGLPISDAGGLDLDTKLANTNEVTTARMGVLTDWINDGRLDLIIDGILADTTEIGTAGAGLTDLGGMSTGMKGEVNTEVADVSRVDTVSEPSQGAPPATPTPEQMLKYIYFMMRNKTETTATEKAMYADNGTTKIMKETLSDNGTTFTESEYVSGA